MLAWARAFVYAHQNQYRMLAPRWVQPRFGAIIRCEPKKRFYVGEFTNDGYIGGWRKWLILQRTRRISETAFEGIARNLSGAEPVVVEFEGLKDYFTSLIPHREAILSELKRIAHPEALSSADQVETPFIAANVRRGDMTRQNKIPLSKILQYTPTEWFVAAIEAIRADPKWQSMPVKIVSDGSADELQELLALENCELVTTGKAVGDILLMTRADLLLASGYSTFSMWASFLGEMPTLYHPGKLQQRLFPWGASIFEGEWKAGDPLPVPNIINAS